MNVKRYRRISQEEKKCLNILYFSLFSSLTWVRSVMTSANSTQRYAWFLLFTHLTHILRLLVFNYHPSPPLPSPRCWTSAGPTTTLLPWTRSAASARPWTRGWAPTATMWWWFTTRWGWSQNEAGPFWTVDGAVRPQSGGCSSFWWPPRPSEEQTAGWSVCASDCVTQCSCLGLVRVKKNQHKLGAEGITVIMATSVYLPLYPQKCHKIGVDQYSPAVASH